MYSTLHYLPSHVISHFTLGFIFQDLKDLAMHIVFAA